MMNVNRMIFNGVTDSEKSLFDNFLSALLEYNRVSENDYNDIHIYQEDTMLVLEWVQIPFNKEWGGSFQYVDEDEFVMKEVNFPDGSYDYAFGEEEKEAMINKWLEEHPEWVKSPYGNWWYEETKESVQIEDGNSAEAGNAAGEN